MKQLQGRSFIQQGIFKYKILGLVIALLISLSAWGLGVGPIQIKSHLNQPLEAIIPLRHLMGLNEEHIKVSVAQNNFFEKRGIYRAPWLSELQLSVVNHSDRSEIQLSTARLIQDPIVEILLNITWPNGDIIRQYTLFLDPLELKETSFETIITSLKSDTQTFHPRLSTTEERRVELYGPVKPDDTLWKIAHQIVTGTPYTLSQGLVALQQKNTDILKNQNMNELLVGSYLQLPTPEEMNSIPAKQATQTLAHHANETEQSIQEQHTLVKDESSNPFLSDKPLKILSAIVTDNKA